MENCQQDPNHPLPSSKTFPCYAVSSKGSHKWLGCREDANTESGVATGAQGHNYVNQARGTGRTVLLGLQCREKIEFGKSSGLKEVTPCLSLFLRYVRDLLFQTCLLLRGFVWLILTVLFCSAYLLFLGICYQKTLVNGRTGNVIISIAYLNLCI